MAVTVLKLYFPKRKPNIQTFRDYERFENDLFISEILKILEILEISDIDIANYADTNTPYACSSNFDSVIFKFQKNTERVFGWFQNNNLITNAEKSRLIVSSKENLEIQVWSCSIRKQDSVKLLGIHINNNMNFDYHVNQICKKTIEKLHGLARIAKYMDINNWRMLMKDFVSSQLFLLSSNMDIP